MQPFAVNDYGPGLMSAMAAVFALFERERIGAGQQAEAALSFTGSILQSPFLIDFDGKKWDEPQGTDARGFGPLQRLYRASNGWFFLGARGEQRSALQQVPGLEGAGSVDEQHLGAELERRFERGTVDHWCSMLVAVGIGAHRLARVGELMRDPWVIEHGLSVTRVHDTGEAITTVGPPARLSATPVRVGSPASTPGAEGPAILQRLGLSATEVTELVRVGTLSLRFEQ